MLHYFSRHVHRELDRKRCRQDMHKGLAGIPGNSLICFSCLSSQPCLFKPSQFLCHLNLSTYFFDKPLLSSYEWSSTNKHQLLIQHELNIFIIQLFQLKFFFILLSLYFVKAVNFSLISGFPKFLLLKFGKDWELKYLLEAVILYSGLQLLMWVEIFHYRASEDSGISLQKRQQDLSIHLKEALKITFVNKSMFDQFIQVAIIHY